MDTSSFSSVGEQLEGFLTKQFTPPEGMQTVLAFFGSGLAVSPSSFISDDGKFNPARVNQWLNISLDVIHTVEEHRIGSAVMSATQLMQAIGGSAMSTAPIGSPTALVLGRIKSQVMEDLGGTTVINTAPLNWYDPAGVAQWSKYTMSIGPDSPPPSPPPGGPRPIPIDRPPLWTWRTLPRVAPETFIPVASHGPVAQVGLHPHPMLMAAAVPKTTLNVGTARVTETNFAAVQPAQSLHLSPGILQQKTAVQPAQTVHFAPGGLQQEIAVQPAQKLQLATGAMAFNNAVKLAVDQASVRPVDAQSMSIDLSYTLVGLSRTPWWNDLLLGMNNWYIPGQRKSSWVGPSIAARSFGVPVQLILTANVQIKAAWSQADRAAAANSSHVGPWSLAGSQISDTGTSGQATLAIPSMQAIGCIYRVLPALPPLDDPVLAPVPVTASG
jgi:hypothetical protein